MAHIKNHGSRDDPVKKRLLQILNILSLAFALALNYLASSQAFGWPSIKAVSDRYATLLTPATYAFSIWAVIYALLVAFVAYQARDLFRSDRRNDLPSKLGPWFIIANLCNGLWTVTFVSDLIGLSVLLLAALTTSLYVLVGRLRMAIYDAPRATIAFTWWPLLFYAGWVSVALIVDITSWLDSIGVAVPSVVACIVLIGLGSALLSLLLLRHVRELLVTAIWGIIAIAVQQAGSGGDRAVMTMALTVGAVLFLSVVAHGVANRKRSPFIR